MITLESIQSAKFEPLGRVDLEGPRLAAMLLGGVAVPPLFTQFVVSLASLFTYVSSDLFNNAHYSSLRSELIGKDELFDLNRVFELWQGNDYYLYRCIEELFLSNWSQAPRLEHENQVQKASKSMEQFHRLMTMDIDQMAQWIGTQMRTPQPPDNVSLVKSISIQLEELLDLIHAPKPEFPSWSKFERSVLEFDSVEDLIPHVLGVYDVVSQVEIYDFNVLYYFSAAYNLVLNHLAPVEDMNLDQETQALESYLCLTNPDEIFDFVRSSQLETEVGVNDLQAAFPAFYDLAFVRLALIQDIIPYSEYLGISHGLGIYPEKPETLAMSQMAFLLGKGTMTP